MTQSKPDTQDTPLSLLGYWQENFAAWQDFGRRTTDLMREQAARPTATTEFTQDKVETLTGDYLRALSDFNLRHWSNTARLLDAMPDWMKLPSVINGAPLTDWFDRIRRGDLSYVYAADRAEGAPEPDRTPAPAAPQTAATTTLDMRQPEPLSAPLGDPDDLTRIKGIGPKLSTLLHELGIFHFKQIAAWDAPQAAWIDDYLAFKGRVTREDWIGQAKAFCANGTSTLH